MTKRDKMIQRGIRLSESLNRRITKRAKEMGFTSISEYMRHLFIKDLDENSLGDIE